MASEYDPIQRVLVRLRKERGDLFEFISKTQDAVHDLTGATATPSADEFHAAAEQLHAVGEKREQAESLQEEIEALAVLVNAAVA